MNQLEKARHFARLHVKGTPVLLYNAWDAGSAKAIEKAGAKAIATGSWSVAAAQGHGDGEKLPLALAQQVAGQIVGAVDVPVTVDMEGGYCEEEAGLGENAGRLLELGVIGINFEDRVVKGEGLYPVEQQARRIAALRAAATKADIPLFINARTDLFLGRGTPNPADSVGPALERARAFAAAGASGFFVPGLVDEGLIGRIAAESPLPVNVMMMKGAPPVKRLGELGVARVSWGPIPFVDAMATLEETARKIFA